MIYKYDKNMHRAYMILDIIHSKGYAKEDYSISMPCDGCAEVNVALGDDIINTLSSEKLPEGWYVNIKNKNIVFTYRNLDTITGDFLDNFYYWIKDHLPKKNKNR